MTLHESPPARADAEVVLRAELGLTPQALAKLLSALTSVAVASGDDAGLGALKAEGARIREARQPPALTDGGEGKEP